MLCELFRIFASHLLFLLAHLPNDVGQFISVFYMFVDKRASLSALSSPICGARMHPGGFESEAWRKIYPKVGRNGNRSLLRTICLLA